MAIGKISSGLERISIIMIRGLIGYCGAVVKLGHCSFAFYNREYIILCHISLWSY